MNTSSALFPAAALLAATLMFGACSKDTDNSPAQEPPVESPDDPGNDNGPGWHLVWEDEFLGPALDTEAWSRIVPPSAGSLPDWMVYQSDDDRCYEFRGGALVLKGIVNSDTDADPRPYLCGGIWSTGKKEFLPGRICVRARMPKGAQGAWPAIWMMPFSPTAGWPDCGEIDIMERLNSDNFVYQTVHSAYVEADKNRTPAYSAQPQVDPSEWHNYEVYVLKERLVFRIDGKTTHEYPRVNGGAGGQYPFYTGWDLRIDMQLGGAWAGTISGAQLPVEMEIDWVRHFLYY